MKNLILALLALCTLAAAAPWTFWSNRTTALTLPARADTSAFGIVRLQTGGIPTVHTFWLQGPDTGTYNITAKVYVAHDEATWDTNSVLTLTVSNTAQTASTTFNVTESVYFATLTVNSGTIPTATGRNRRTGITLGISGAQ